jgi:hypothetical protein
MGEQKRLVGGTTAPDGWSWDDVYVDRVKTYGVGGDVSGATMQRGEPILEQNGHTLLVRQGETSFEPRQRTIYEKLSRMTLAHEETGEDIPAIEVLVVHGFKGQRFGYTAFRDGVEHTVLEGGPEPIREYVLDWFDRSRKNKITRRVKSHELREQVEQVELA